MADSLKKKKKSQSPDFQLGRNRKIPAHHEWSHVGQRAQRRGRCWGCPAGWPCNRLSHHLVKTFLIPGFMSLKVSSLIYMKENITKHLTRPWSKAERCNLSFQGQKNGNVSCYGEIFHCGRGEILIANKKYTDIYRVRLTLTSATALQTQFSAPLC